MPIDDGPDFVLERSLDEQRGQPMRKRPHGHNTITDVVDRRLRTQHSLNMIHEDVERLIGHFGQYSVLVHLRQIGTKHDAEMPRVLEREVDIPFEQRRCCVDILTALGRAQCLCEHREAFDGYRLKNSPAIGEVVIGGLVAHSSSRSHLPKGQTVGAVCRDVVDCGPKNRRAQIRWRHGARIRADLDTVKYAG